ncbi:MAG TPA: magnesium transporter CorA family protein [bacterium]|nr:magnesium transporter CorA family protein [bacterium]
MRRYDFAAFHWLDVLDPQKREIAELSRKYDFHELDREALSEENQRDRVDTYDNYLFLTLHFPKYNTVTKRYIGSEFNFFVSKEYLVGVRYYASKTIDSIFDGYERKGGSPEETPGDVLYDVIDAMLDKIFRGLDKFTIDVRLMERRIFDQAGNRSVELIEELMVKKRNIVTLKHMLKPQVGVLKILELRMNAMFGADRMEDYFESLQDKMEQIQDEITLLQENLESMEDTLKSIFDLETNSIIKYLTIFSAFMLPLTLVTSFFGMNLASAPFNDWFVYGWILILGGVAGAMVWWILRDQRGSRKR